MPIKYRSGATTSGGGGAATDTIYDAKGDIVVGTGADAAARLAVGTNNQVLTADSGETTGTKWATPASATTVANDTLWDAKGDVVGATGADAAARLAVGANDLVLTADSAASTGLAWKRTQAGRKQRLWMPSGISGTAQSALIDENLQRGELTLAAAAQSTGALKLYGGCVIPSGVTCSKAIAYQVGAGSGLTHNWAVLTDQSGVILAITADDTTATNSVATYKTFTWTTPYVAVADIGVYVGLCWVGSSIPTIPQRTVISGIAGELPKMAMSSNTSLTDPASLGAGPVTLGASTTSSWVAIA